MSASHSSLQSLSLSSWSFFCAVATYTSVSVVLRPSLDLERSMVSESSFEEKIKPPYLAMLASMMEKSLSIPMETPTQGTSLFLGSNMPTSLSYLPPPATLPTRMGSPFSSLLSPVKSWSFSRRRKTNQHEYVFQTVKCKPKFAFIEHKLLSSQLG